MTEKYYLTKNGGETFEEMSLYEIGREVLDFDGAEHKLVASYNLSVKRKDSRHWSPLNYYMGIPSASVDLHVCETSKSDFEIDESGEVMILLREKVGQTFIDNGTWDNVPDHWQACTEEGYQEELQWRKDNSDD